MSAPRSPQTVNHPAHYKAGGIEAIDVIEAFDLNFRLGNVVKYILRAERKGATLEDLNLRRLKKSIMPELLERQNYRCQYCGCKGDTKRGPDGKSWHLEHKKPQSKGGTDEAVNLCASCGRCNSRKGTREAE